MRNPKKDNGRVVPKGKSQVNFNLCTATMEKAKDLAHLLNVPVAEIYNKGIIRFLEHFEKENGEIKRRPSGKGLDTL